MLKSVRHWQGT